MNKEQFLQELQENLHGEVDSQVIYDSVSYYRSYIEEQIRSGKSQQQVLDELGDAAFIAKSIVDANERRGGRRNETEEDVVSYGDPYEEMERQERKEKVTTGMNHIVHLVIGIVAFIVVLAVVGMIAKVLLPVILVVAAVLFIKRLFDNRQ